MFSIKIINTLKHFIKTQINDKEDSIDNINQSNYSESVFDICFLKIITVQKLTNKMK